MNNQTVYIAVSGSNKIKFFNLDELKVIDFIANYNYNLQLKYMKRLENSYEIFDDSIQDYFSVIDDYLLSLKEINLDKFNEIKNLR